MYFNSQGRAEVSRLLFALARQPYVDDRSAESAKAASRPIFDSLKPTLPFGQLPVLQLEGEGGPLLAQSRAIERFLARRFGLMGGSDVEEQQVDSVTEAVRDLTQAYASSRDQPDAQDRFLSLTLPSFLHGLTRLAERCSTSSARNTLVGASLTLADVVLYQVLTTPTPDQPAVSKLIDGFPPIRAVIANVANQPEMRDWVATRPA